MESLELVGYRRAVAELYRRARLEAPEDPEGAWLRWRSDRDDLLASHPQSPVPATARTSFTGMAFHPYDHRWRLEVEVVPVGTGSGAEVPHSGAVASEWRPVGEVAVRWPTGTGSLRVLWLTTYGGGLFVPFRDATNGDSTYGGGRYLLDTVKGADLGGAAESGRLVLDLNFAYNPSCAYDPAWACPLAPPGNVLDVEVPVGEGAHG